MTISKAQLPRELDVYPTVIGTVTPRELYLWLQQVDAWLKRQLARGFTAITIPDNYDPRPTIGELEQFMSTPIYLLWETCESLHRARKCWDELNRTDLPGTEAYEKQLLSIFDASKDIVAMAFMTGTDIKARNAQLQKQQQEAYAANLRRIRHIQKQYGLDVPEDPPPDDGEEPA